jgi:hypothetical protein
MNSEPSNFRELNNLVVTLEDGAAKGTLDGAEAFIFTDQLYSRVSVLLGQFLQSSTLLSNAPLAQA